MDRLLWLRGGGICRLVVCWWDEMMEWERVYKSKIFRGIRDQLGCYV